MGRCIYWYALRLVLGSKKAEMSHCALLTTPFTAVILLRRQAIPQPHRGRGPPSCMDVTSCVLLLRYLLSPRPVAETSPDSDMDVMVPNHSRHRSHGSIHKEEFSGGMGYSFHLGLRDWDGVLKSPHRFATCLWFEA
jgi:hypothetical protein